MSIVGDFAHRVGIIKSNSVADDFGLAYAHALTKIFNEWLHDEDSGCDYDSVGRRQVYPHNNILMIFQPKGSEGWIEDASVIFTLTKEARATGKKLKLSDYSDIIDTIHQKLYESFCNFMKISNNKWFSSMEKEYTSYSDFVNHLCSIKKPLNEEKGVIKFTYEIKWFYMDYSIHRWNAVEVMKWMKTSPSYEAYINSIKAQHAAKKCIYCEEKQCNEVCKSIRENDLIEALPRQEEEYVDNDDPEIFTEFVEKRGILVESIPLIKPLVGVKRKRSEDYTDAPTNKKSRSGE